MSQDRSPWMFRLSVGTAGATWVLLFVGGLVTSTGSGLSVPDWPLSYGMLFPPMVGGILYEHGHRMVAGLVALLMSALTLWLWLRERRVWVRLFALTAWLLVLIQAVLGGMTVLLRLPVVVSVAHAGVAELFFAATVLLAYFLSPRWAQARPRTASSAAVYRWSLAATLATFGQILLGAWVRHSGAGLAIPDFPTHFGRWIPPLSNDALRWVNEYITGKPYIPAVQGMDQVRLHFAHRMGAVLVALMLLGLWREVRRNYRDDRDLVWLANGTLGLVLLQIALGAWIIWSQKAVFPATIHLAVGALTFGTTVLLAAMVRRHYRLAVAPSRVESGGEEAPA